jgi:hypothetical protein
MEVKNSLCWVSLGYLSRISKSLNGKGKEARIVSRKSVNGRNRKPVAVTGIET